MRVILVYDINVKRVAKVLKICRKYLHWVQNQTEVIGTGDGTTTFVENIYTGSRTLSLKEKSLRQNLRS